MPRNRLGQFAVMSACITLMVTVSGGVVSATGSGAACTAWPLCNELLDRATTWQTWLALSHRLLVIIAMVAAVVGALQVVSGKSSIDRVARMALILAPMFGLLQIGFGAMMVELQLYAVADLSHLLLALLMLGCQTVAATALFQPATELRMGGRATRDARRLRMLAWWTAGAAGVLTLALSARATVGPTASVAALLPTNAGGALVMASLLGTGTLWQTWRTRRSDRWILFGAWIVALLPVAVVPLILLGVAGFGVGVAASLWVAAVALAVVATRRPLPVAIPTTDVQERSERQPSLLSDYISLTKPKVISLLLVTTAGAMYITEAGAPSLWLVFWTMVGGYLAAGGAGAINCAFDSDIDINMGRTSRRPVPSGRISRRNAMIFGLSLSFLSVVVMLLFTTPLAALLSTLGIVYYAWFYTQWLKRSTWQNIVIGGGAGAIPPLVGWTATTGQLSVAALLLFAIVFYWTPPHFWALALVKQKDYARAGVPMLPVVAGEAETHRQILIYSILLVALSLLPGAIGAMGWIYLVAALGLGAIFLYYAWAVWRKSDQGAIWGLYKYSLLYLALLFAAMVLDRAIL